MTTIRDAVPDPKLEKDDVFAEIADLAAQVCGARYSAITLHDGTQHRTLATHGGIALALMPRDTRFCCEVLHSGAPLEVSDARFDLRFHEDPLVASGPRVRFYSGVPLVAGDGRIAGTLSVFDVRAKALTRIQRGALWKLADVVMRLIADIEARRAAEETLSWQATHDTLTDLENRRQFETVLGRHIESARVQGTSHAVLYIDLDQFKVVNDTCGHAAGDSLLRQLAHVLLAKMRRGDSLARLGGDEFVALAAIEEDEGAESLTERLQEQFDLSNGLRARPYNLSVSVGVANFENDHYSIEDLMAQADRAMYEVKRQKPSRYTYRPQFTRPRIEAVA